MKVRVRTLGNEEVEVEAQPEKGEKVSTLKEKIERQWAHMPAARQRLVHAGKVLADAQLLSETSIKDGDRIVVMLTKAAAAGAAAVAGGSSSSSSSSSNTAAAKAAAGTTQSASSSASDSSSAAANEAAAGSSSSAPAAGGAASAPAAAAKSESSASAEAATSSAAQGAAVSGGAGGDAAANSSAQSSATRSHTAAESVLQTGVQLEETLEQLVMMGFPRQRAEQAMRAAFNNPDRAVEYLMNGLPENVGSLLGAGGVGLPGDGDAAAAAAVAAAEAELQQQEEEAGEGQADEDDDEAAAATAADSSNPLDALRRHPAFNQIRQMVQANPAMLPQVLQLIGSSNPQLLELITQNQDAFLEVLQQEDADEAAAAATQQQGNFADPATGVIQITRDEMEALQRLEALGFTRHQAVEAYLACDRNEEMAANFLLENINDLDGDGASRGSGAAE